VVVGVIVALAGFLFALQGFGAVSGSPMSNTSTWSVLGPIIALIGIATEPVNLNEAPLRGIY